MFAQTDKIREKRNKKPTLFFKNQLIISATKFLHFTDIKDIFYLKFKSYSVKIRKSISFFRFFLNSPLTPVGEPNPQCKKMKFALIRTKERVLHQSFNLPVNYHHLSKNKYFMQIQNDRFVNLNIIKSKYILHNSLMMPKLINRTIIIISFYNILQNLLK